MGNVYLSTLERLREDLDTLEDDAWLTRDACPACLHRDAGIPRHAYLLLGELAHDVTLCDWLAASSGLCVPHFQLAWDLSHDPRERRQLTAVQSRAVGRLIDETREYLRGQRNDVGGDPATVGVHCLRRAMWLTAGWPDRAAPRRGAEKGAAGRPTSGVGQPPAPGPHHARAQD